MFGMQTDLFANNHPMYVVEASVLISQMDSRKIARKWKERTKRGNWMLLKPQDNPKHNRVNKATILCNINLPVGRL